MRCLGFSCPFRQLTGYDCPGCGGTRAVTALLHGQLTEAVHYNAMLLLVALGAGGALCRTGDLPAILAVDTMRRRIAAVLIVVGWTVLRNVPQLSYFNADRR